MTVETQNCRTAKTVTAGSDLSLVTVNFIVKYNNKIRSEMLCDCNLTSKCIRENLLAVESVYELTHVNMCLYSCLIIQHAQRIRHIILASAACLAAQYFSHYLIKGTIFENICTSNMCFDFLFTFCLINVS